MGVGDMSRSEDFEMMGNGEISYDDPIEEGDGTWPGMGCLEIKNWKPDDRGVTV